MKSTRKHPSNRSSQDAVLTQETATPNDIYARVIGKIIADLENGNLTWRKPWNADHLAGQVTRPLRWNDIPYNGVNTLMLWGTAAEQGYASPYWMTSNRPST